MKKTTKIDNIEKKLKYFRDVRHRINNIQKIKENNFEEEAFILCLVYLGQISSLYYKGKKDGRNFCKLLIQKAENPIFTKIYIPMLLQRLKFGECEAICLSQDPRKKKIQHVTVYPWQEALRYIFKLDH